MKNKILDDHLMEIPKASKEKKRPKFKRPQSPILIGFGRFFIAQIVMLMFVSVFGYALNVDTNGWKEIFIFIPIAIGSFLTMGIVGYNIVMGLEELTEDKILDYGDGTLGGIVIIILIFLTIIISIFILYRNDIDMWMVFSSIPIVLFFVGLRWVYDEILGKH